MFLLNNLQVEPRPPTIVVTNQKEKDKMLASMLNYEKLREKQV